MTLAIVRVKYATRGLPLWNGFIPLLQAPIRFIKSKLDIHPHYPLKRIQNSKVDDFMKVTLHIFMEGK